MSFLRNLFGGGNRNSGSSSSRTRDEKSVQADINKALKDSGGKWTSNLNDLVAERDRARSGATTSSSGRSSLSQGLGSFGNAVRSIPGNIARDVRMGTSAGLFSSRDKQAENLAKSGFSQREIGDFFSRTDATRARNEAEMAQRRDSGPSAEERAQAAAQRAQQMQQMQQTQQQAPMQQSPIYRNPFGQAGTTVMPQPGRPGDVSPDMQREALRIFESQRGAGQIPYQMLPYQQGLGSMRAQQRLQNETFGTVPDRMRQMPVGGFGQPDQASTQAQLDDLARRRADPDYARVQQLIAMETGQRRAPQMPVGGLGSMRRPGFMPQLSQRQDPFAAARSMGMQVGPTPGRQNPFAGIPVQQLQQMNEQIRQQNMMRQSASRAPDPFDGMRSIGGDQFMQPAVMPPDFNMPRLPEVPLPRLPMPQPPMRQNPNVSPAFHFAAQNYNRLGGMQRTMDRPMEMMSVAERQRINDMARGMSSMQRPTAFSGKGGGQRPTMSPGKGGGAVLPGVPAMGIASLLGRGRSF